MHALRLCKSKCDRGSPQYCARDDDRRRIGRHRPQTEDGSPQRDHAGGLDAFYGPPILGHKSKSSKNSITEGGSRTADDDVVIVALTYAGIEAA
jgi:hypothetical protein